MRQTLIGAVTAAVVVSTMLAAAATAQTPEGARRATEYVVIPGVVAIYTMWCLPPREGPGPPGREQRDREVPVPCEFHGIELQHFADGETVLNLLHPDSPGLDPTSMSLYFPPDPRVAELEEVLARLIADQDDLRRRLKVLESRQGPVLTK